MKKVLFIHGFEGSCDKNWFPWLQKQLQQFSYAVVNETLPNSAHPDYEESLSFLKDATKDFTPQDSVLGHSLGAFFALKLAEEMEFDRLYAIAPAVGDLPFKKYQEMWPGSDVDALQKVVEKGVDMKKVQAKRKIAVFSDDDPYIPLETASYFDESWKIITMEGYGHFQEKQYPELLSQLIS